MALNLLSKPSIEREVQAQKKSMNFRIDTYNKALIEEAADIEGVSVTDFVISAARSKAVTTIQENAEIQAIHLYKEDSLRFAEMLLNPPAPNEALRELMKGRS